MAKYRNISTDFWLDPFVLDLTPEEKYFYIYLMLNKHATFCGIYSIHKKVMEVETGYNRETVQKLIDRFVEYEKVLYNEENNEIMMLNWVKYNQPNNVNVVKGIIAELQETKTIEFVKTYIELALPVTTKDEHKDMLISAYREVNQGATKGLGRGYQVIEIEREIEKEIEIESEIERKDIVDTNVSNASSNSNTPHQEIVNIYNQICSKELPRVQVISDKRKRAIRSMWKFVNEDIEVLKNIFMKAMDSDFLTGRNGKWTSCNFDWLMNKNNAIKVIEGNYDNKKASNKESISDQVKSDAVQSFLNGE